MDSFREWLSDNLRYIMLIVAILIFLAAVFFGVRAMTRFLDGGSDSSAGNKPAAESTAESDSKEVKDDSSTASRASSTASGASSTASDESSQADAERLIENYFEAVGRQDLDAVLSMVDSLTEEEKASVRDDRTVYSNIKVLLRDGVQGEDKDYIAFVSYDFKNETQYVTHYGLSWLYLQRTEDGALQIMVQGASDSKVNELADTLMADKEVAEMLASVKIKAAVAEEEEEKAAA